MSAQRGDQSEGGAPSAMRSAHGGSRIARHTAIADFDDRATLAHALRGSDGVFVMLPTIPTGSDAEHRRMADSIAADSGVPHVVLLSSIGADRSEGDTGPIRWLHHLETALREVDVVLTTVRSCHFQEKVETVLGAALGAGVYPVFGEKADVPTPMVATRDIGRVVADSLLAPPAAIEIVDLEGPSYTEHEVADRLATVLGKPLQVVTIPRSGWIDAMVDAGLPAPFARELAGLHDAEQRGILHPHGDRLRTCATPLDDTLRHVVESATSAASR